MMNTKFGEAVYPYLTIPDTKFDQLGKYHVKLKLQKEDAEKDIKAINDLIAKRVSEFTTLYPSKPVKRADLPYEITDDGYCILHFKMKARGINTKTQQQFEQRPKIFDHNLDPISDDQQIWSGSIIRVNYDPFIYENAVSGIGCSLRLKSVQVKKLVNGTQQPFSKVEPELSEGAPI